MKYLTDNFFLSNKWEHGNNPRFPKGLKWQCGFCQDRKKVILITTFGDIGGKKFDYGAEKQESNTHQITRIDY